MTSRDFCFWLQGALELSDVKELNVKQVEILKNHLSLAFIHDIDPSMGDEEKQEILNNVHSGFQLHNTNGEVMRC